MAVRLTGLDLTLDEVRRVSFDFEPIELTEDARERVRASRAVVDRILSSDRIVYGINTGFGNFRDVVIPRAELEQLQVNLLRSHSAGVGDALPEPIVRTIILLRINTLAKGYSGVHPDTLDGLVALLEARVHPVIPEKGSVGASGDLAPLAHLASVLIGEGEAVFRGRTLSGAAALAEAGLRPLTLQPKDGLALINGTQVTSALLAHALLDAEVLIRSADLVGALTVDALLGSDRAFDPRIQAVRPHPGQVKVARNLTRLLAGSPLRESHRNCGRVQDAYSLRCMPQVHGAVRDAVDYGARVLAIEMNAATDNPIVIAESDEVIAGGDFHGQPVAIAADFATIALAELGVISERRIERLVNPQLSGLPPFLVRDGGLNSGYMLAQVTAAALASQNKTLSHPASVDSIPTSANQEDHVSMGVGASSKTLDVVENLKTILAIELLAASQGLDFHRPRESSRALEAVHRLVRSEVPHLESDRRLHKDFEAAQALLTSGQVLAVAEGELGPLE